jgi:hypothetical protein
MFHRPTSSIKMAFIATMLLSLGVATVAAFTPSPLFTPSTRMTKSSSTVQNVVQSNSKTKGYEPKWTKKKTMAEDVGSAKTVGFDGVGLKGTIPVVFKQGNETKTSMAWAGQPLRDVATQAGQYIKYGCGKGECGTCECMVNGKWVRPCIITVPATAAGEEYSVQLKEASAKVVSSGKFFSFRSFIMGFWNNLLGMIGFVQTRRAARKSMDERIDYEELVKQKAAEKRAVRLARETLEGGTA